MRVHVPMNLEQPRAAELVALAHVAPVALWLYGRDWDDTADGAFVWTGNPDPEKIARGLRGRLVHVDTGLYRFRSRP